MRIMEKTCSLQQLNFLIHYRFGVRAIISFSQIFEAVDKKKKKTLLTFQGPNRAWEDQWSVIRGQIATIGRISGAAGTTTLQ